MLLDNENEMSDESYNTTHNNFESADINKPTYQQQLQSQMEGSHSRLDSLESKLEKITTSIEAFIQGSPQ